MEKLNKLLSWGFEMAKKELKKAKLASRDLLPVILKRSDSRSRLSNEKSEAIKLILTEIILQGQINPEIDSINVEVSNAA